MSQDRPYVALMGNPNSGKTAIFNLLTGMNLKVSNYPGITVEMRRCKARISSLKTVEIMDLPVTYSLTPESIDEKIVAQQTLRWMGGEDRPQAIISVVDAANLKRNLYLTSQLLDLNIPIIIALNMMDRVRRRKKSIDPEFHKKVKDTVAQTRSKRRSYREPIPTSATAATGGAFKGHRMMEESERKITKSQLKRIIKEEISRVRVEKFLPVKGAVKLA